MVNKETKDRYGRMQLKNGPEIAAGEKKPPSIRKQRLARAYELLVLKSDEDYIREAREAEAEKEKNAVTVSAPVHTEKAAEAVKTVGTESPTNDFTPDDKTTEGSRREEKDDEAHKILGMLSEQEWRNKRRRRKWLTVGIIAALILVFAGRFLLGPAVLLADISTYEDVKITVEGIEKKPFTITPGELAGMKKTSVKVDVFQGELAEGEEPELGKAVGPTLDTFLKKYGKTRDDFKSMRAYAENEESKAYVKTMKDKTLVLSVANGRKPLGEKEAPLRIAVEGESTDEWYGWVRKIVFVK